MHFEFATAARIVFGPGKIRDAISAAVSLGRRTLIVTGRNPGRLESFLEELRAQEMECTLFPFLGEPTILEVLKGVETAKRAECELVIGCGGGSALDGAKAIAALMTNPGNPLDYLEVVGSGNPLTQSCAPCICIPTTAGTGCEVTRNSVLISPEHRVKVSLRSHKMLPLLAVVDPELTYSLPPAITASTGLDALTQLIEPFISIYANPLCDSLCREGIFRAARWLREACKNGENAEARENMSLASLFGGLALANAGLGVVHGLAAPLGGMLPVPHGVVCARLLPRALATNLKALRVRDKDSQALSRLDEIGRLLTSRSAARAEDGIEWMDALVSDMSVPRLSSFGLAEKDLPAIAGQAQKSSSMRGNPVQLTPEELLSILESAL